MLDAPFGAFFRPIFRRKLAVRFREGNLVDLLLHHCELKQLFLCLRIFRGVPEVLNYFNLSFWKSQVDPKALILENRNRK